MIDSGGGSIINVHSVEGMRGYPGDPVYGAMKAAVNRFLPVLPPAMEGTGSELTAWELILLKQHKLTISLGMKT